MAASEKFKKRLLELIADSELQKFEYAAAVDINNNTLSHATLYGIIPNVTSLTKIANLKIFPSIIYWAIPTTRLFILPCPLLPFRKG